VARDTTRPARPGNYAVQAKTYDRTRGASPTIVRALAKPLGPAEGRKLLDIGGGTGNYARVFQARGFRVAVVDASVDMLANVARKVGSGHAIAADAERLPIRDGSIDCAIMVNAFHQLGRPAAALADARRVVRDGPFIITVFTRENLAPLFVYEYFGLRGPMTERLPANEVARLVARAGFSRVEHEPYVYTDTVDGSLNALHINANYLAGPAYLQNTSFWHQLDEETRRKGLEALAEDRRSGVLAERVKVSYALAAEHGHGTVFAAWP
jgi:ubiquinone/menaquinone biosynthesis C-methylase UbiE